MIVLYTGLIWYELREWAPYVYRIAMDSMLWNVLRSFGLESDAEFLVIMMKRIYALSLAHSRFSTSKSRLLNSAYWVLGIMVAALIAKYAVSVTFLLQATGPNSGIYGESRSQRLIMGHLSK